MIIKKYNDYNKINEKISDDKYEYTIKDVVEFADFAYHVKKNVFNEPNLLRAFINRSKKVLDDINNNKLSKDQSITILGFIYYVIEGFEGEEWIKNLQTILPEENKNLYSFVLYYNDVVNDMLSKYPDLDKNQINTIKHWLLDFEE